MKAEIRSPDCMSSRSRTGVVAILPESCVETVDCLRADLSLGGVISPGMQSSATEPGDPPYPALELVSFSK